jgi:hypoxanthine phosphoribosyltransferase
MFDDNIQIKVMSRYIPETIQCNGQRFISYLNQSVIQQRIAEIGAELTRKFQDKRPIFIGVLNGAFIFLSDLIRHVQIPCEVDFLKLSSYGDAKVSSGQVTNLKNIDADIAGRHVILVEDIVDTGLSMKYLTNQLEVYKPESLSVVTLLHKTEATRHPVQLDYVGFEIPDKFVLGYGLDYSQEGRNLDQIYILDE